MSTCQRVPVEVDPRDRLLLEQIGRLSPRATRPDSAQPEKAMPYIFRRLTLRDLGALERTHHALLSSLSHPHVLRADTLDHLERNILRTGVTFGAFLDDELVAYAATEFGGPSAALVKEAFPAASLPATTELAVHDGSGVVLVHRGHGLQDVLNELRLSEARTRGFHNIVGTVSPRNPFCLRNHLKRGFAARGYAEMYGGMPRLLIHARLDGAATAFEWRIAQAPASASITLPGTGADWDILNRGFGGVQLEETVTGWQLTCGVLAE